MCDYRVSEKKCPKCNGVMETGRLASYGYVGWAKSRWQWSYSKVSAFRCKKCGYVELYVE